MYIIAIETTGADASASLINEDGRQFTECVTDRMNHLQNLMPAIELLLRNSGVSKQELDYVAVSEGPGSFTGIRIGMAAAKGLTMALGTGMISVPTLKSFAYHDECRKPGIICCPLFDARKSQVYAGAYYWNSEDDLKILVKDGAYKPSDFFSLVKDATEATEYSDLKKCIIYGDGIAAYQDEVNDFINCFSVNDAQITQCEGYGTECEGQSTECEGHGTECEGHGTECEGLGTEYEEQDTSRIFAHIAAEYDRFQNARYTAMMALDMLKRGETVGINEIEPVYIRKAEAQRKLEEAEAREKSEKLKTASADENPQSESEPESEKTSIAHIDPNEIIIRKANAADVDSIAKLDKLCFKLPWSRESFESDIVRNSSTEYLAAATPAGDIAGYAGIWCVLDEGQVTNIAVHPDCRNAGLGTRLVNELISAAEARGAVNQTLEVRESNRDAILLYKRAGFEVKGIRKKYYNDNGENALIMWRNKKTDI